MRNTTFIISLRTFVFTIGVFLLTVFLSGCVPDSPVVFEYEDNTVLVSEDGEFDFYVIENEKYEPDVKNYLFKEADDDFAFIDDERNIWVHYADGNELQIAKNSDRTIPCSPEQPQVYGSPILSRDAQFVLVGSYCKDTWINDSFIMSYNEEVYIIHVPSHEIVKVADGDLGGFDYQDGSMEIFVRKNPVYKRYDNPLEHLANDIQTPNSDEFSEVYSESSDPLYVDKENGFQVSLKHGYEFRENGLMFFGPPYFHMLSGMEKAKQSYYLYSDDPETADELLKSLEDSMWYITTPLRRVDIGELEVYEYIKGDSCPTHVHVILGKKHDYFLEQVKRDNDNCNKDEAEELAYITELIESFELID